MMKCIFGETTCYAISLSVWFDQDILQGKPEISSTEKQINATEV